MDKLRNVFQQMLENISDLYCILITDREGVIVLKMSTNKYPEQATKPGFINTFGLAIDQGSKLGLGKTETMICYYSQYQVVQMNKLPVVVTFIAGEACNTGHILALENVVDCALTNVIVAVNEA